MLGGRAERRLTVSLNLNKALREKATGGYTLTRKETGLIKRAAGRVTSTSVIFRRLSR